MSREAGMVGIETQERTPGSLTAAISQLIVKLFSEYTGRGPNTAHTTIRENVVICVTQANLTKGERRLVDEGEASAVVSIRRKFQMTMRSDLVPGVEERSVIERQFARLASVCRPFAPMYRQITLPQLRAGQGTGAAPPKRGAAGQGTVDIDEA